MLGFLITVGVFVKVEGIRKHFLRRARMPDLYKSLTSVSSKYNEALNNWPSLHKEAHFELITALPLLRVAISITKRSESPEIHSAHKAIKGAIKKFNSATSYDDAWRLYAELQSAMTSMNQLKKNMKWE
jgi:hypothetical protein